MSVVEKKFKLFFIPLIDFLLQAAEALVSFSQIDRPARKVHNFISFLEPMPILEQQKAAEVCRL